MRRFMLLTVLTFGAGVAHAENGFFYLGAGISHNDVSNINDLGGQADISGSSWKAFVGVRPLNTFAFEADYMDFGSGNSTLPPAGILCPPGQTCNGSAHSDGNAYAGYVVGFLPIPLPIVDVYGKVGAAHWKLNGDVNTPLSSSGFSHNGTDFAWGIGVQAHITMFGARLEYENFNIPNTSGAKIASLSVFLNL